MKKIGLLFGLMLFVSIAFAQTGKLTITFKFANIVDGYDHTCKTIVYVDGDQVGESPEVLESKGTTFTVDIPLGNHKVRVSNWALYEGNWEEHTVDNQYSIDCFWEGDMNVKEKQKMFMLHDIDSETKVSFKKMPKLKKKKK